MDAKTLLTALGLFLLVEGAAYALFPRGMRDTMQHIARLPDAQLRQMGLTVAVAGAAIVFMFG